MDVHGWGKVTWGMTVAQAKAALGPEAKAAEGENTFTDGYIARLVLKKLKVGDIDMDVSIAAKSGSERIALISLELADKPQDTGSRGAAYHGLLNALTRKYGRPTKTDKEIRDDTDVETNSAQWVLPSTNIDLVWIENRDLGFGVLHLMYSPVSRKMQDAL